MELVYLWVEAYKNIHKQGFNFSPRFNCKYDEINNELSIEENKDYINIFPVNVNVTAIVGKNGSGKSSLLEILNLNKNKKIKKIIIFTKNNQLYCEYTTTKPTTNKNNIKFIYNDINNFNDDSFFPECFNIACNQKIGNPTLPIYYFGQNISVSISHDRSNIYNMNEPKFFVPRYINIILNDVAVLRKISKLYRFNTLRLVLRDNSSNYLEKFLNDEIDTVKNHITLSPSNDFCYFCVYKKDSDTLNHINEKYFSKKGIDPNKCIIKEYDKGRQKLLELLKELEKLHRSQSNSSRNPILNEPNKYQEFNLAVLMAFIEYYLKVTEPCSSVQLLIDELESLIHNIYNQVNERREVLLKNGIDSIHIPNEYILDFFYKLKEIGLTLEENNGLNLGSIIEALEYFSQFKCNYFDYEGNPYFDIPIDEDLQKNIKKVELFQKIFDNGDPEARKHEKLPVFEYDLFNLEVGSSYSTISCGEKQFLQVITDILYHKDYLFRINFNTDEKLATFLLDEPDNSLHPIWKKQVFMDIFNLAKIDLEKNRNINLHIIFTTHSPFLISDLPKENIIFLDTYKEDDEEIKKGEQKIGKCKVLSHDEVLEKKQTFGANIHTLLSDSFFMNDGLMGEFAKSKINEIKDFYDFVLRVKKIIKKNNIQKRLDKLYLKKKEIFWQIQKIIGEPFLQKIVKNQLEEIETILFNERAKEVVIERFIKEFGADEILKVLNGEV